MVVDRQKVQTSSELQRLGSRLDAIFGRFRELDEAERVLTGRLKRHRQALDKQKQQKQVWTSLLEDSLSTVEVSLLLGYVSDTFHSCHTLVLQRVPDLAPSLPTTASVLRTQPKNRRGYQCDYQRTGKRDGQQQSDVGCDTEVCQNQALRAMQVVERGKAGPIEMRGGA
ncbi:single-pass membrane and coiled-coil domain-containing protein 1 [Salvelinus sp. IW2-2015]|uniref:single-pass membrane and coiled-coil domain-containing protein 1 n=1 Tax=Salvelinus sp. IW2-2015 TaxID=2691554 RepID=UPI000CDFD0EE|nr:single-pass membrane and coiled-coil domain-containing protein 1 [Salvelinus alpinus]